MLAQVEIAEAVEVRRVADGARAEDWALVLSAAGIAHELTFDPASDDWVLRVAAPDADAARSALTAWDLEQAEPAEPALPVHGAWWLGAAAVAVSLGVYFFIGSRDGGSALVARGSARAASMFAQPWRAVTALTLHGDFGHLAGNAVFALILIGAVGWWLGPGVGALLLVAAGATANLAVAAVVRSGFDSLGLSTALFAAIGVLVALAARARRKTRRRAIVVAGAALAFLGLLSSGEHVDILAHAFGMFAGVALGAVAAWLVRRPPGRVVQIAAGLAALSVIAASWALAIY
jgi:membrane associated rhomboid family serine protease